MVEALEILEYIKERHNDVRLRWAELKGYDTSSPYCNVPENCENIYQVNIRVNQLLNSISNAESEIAEMLEERSEAGIKRRAQEEREKKEAARKDMLMTLEKLRASKAIVKDKINKSMAVDSDRMKEWSDIDKAN